MFVKTLRRFANSIAESGYVQRDRRGKKIKNGTRMSYEQSAIDVQEVSRLILVDAGREIGMVEKTRR